MYIQCAYIHLVNEPRWFEYYTHTYILSEEMGCTHFLFRTLTTCTSGRCRLYFKKNYRRRIVKISAQRERASVLGYITGNNKHVRYDWLSSSRASRIYMYVCMYMVCIYTCIYNAHHAREFQVEHDIISTWPLRTPAILWPTKLYAQYSHFRNRMYIHISIYATSALRTFVCENARKGTNSHARAKYSGNKSRINVRIVRCMYTYTRYFLVIHSIVHKYISIKADRLDYIFIKFSTQNYTHFSLYPRALHHHRVYVSLKNEIFSI